MRVRIVGRGRAGGAFAVALARVGVEVDLVPGAAAAIESSDVDVVLLCVPDGAIGDIARRVRPAEAVVAHCAGSQGLDVLGDHARVGSVHPLMSLPDAASGAERLLDECTFAVAGDQRCRALVDRLGGRAIEVPDERRALYHATASIAANHLVALSAQVERLAAAVGVPFEAYLRLMTATLEHVGHVGARAALTGPAARGDHGTLAAHLDALPPAERPLYEALMSAARSLAAETSG